MPGIVTGWVRGFAPPPKLTEADTLPVVPPSDPLVTSSVQIQVVGITPKPADASPLNLTSRLRSLHDEACRLGWIDNVGVCNSLDAKLRAALGSLQKGMRSTATKQLGAYANELGAQRGKHLSDSGYFLLQSNAAYIVTLLG